MQAESRDRLRALIASRRDARPARWAASVATRYLHQFHNHNDRMDSNGERRVVQAVAALRPKVVFDVGANIGLWSQLMAPLVPPGTVHAFEPVQGSIDRLRVATADHHVVVNEFALGSSTGTLDLFLAGGEHTVLASPVRVDFSAYADAGPVRTETCAVKRADEYCAEAGIATVDFVKIDVEGYEYEVLRGFGAMLADGSVRAVQFEYGDASITAGRFLADFARLLGDAGFALGKIYPNRVDFAPYSVSHERWAGLNHIAVRHDWPALISRLS